MVKSMNKNKQFERAVHGLFLILDPSIEDQATDRAHRIGQERNVTVIRLVSANTIEEKILKLHEDKQSLSDRILDGTSESAALTMDEILDMVSPYR